MKKQVTNGIKHTHLITEAIQLLRNNTSGKDKVCLKFKNLTPQTIESNQALTYFSENELEQTFYPGDSVLNVKIPSLVENHLSNEVGIIEVSLFSNSKQKKQETLKIYAYPPNEKLNTSIHFETPNTSKEEVIKMARRGSRKSGRFEEEEALPHPPADSSYGKNRVVTEQGAVDLRTIQDQLNSITNQLETVTGNQPSTVTFPSSSSSSTTTTTTTTSDNAQYDGQTPPECIAYEWREVEVPLTVKRKERIEVRKPAIYIPGHFECPPGTEMIGAGGHTGQTPMPPMPDYGGGYHTPGYPDSDWGDSNQDWGHTPSPHYPPQHQQQHQPQTGGWNQPTQHHSQTGGGGWNQPVTTNLTVTLTPSSVASSGTFSLMVTGAMPNEKIRIEIYQNNQKLGQLGIYTADTTGVVNLANQVATSTAGTYLFKVLSQSNRSGQATITVGVGGSPTGIPIGMVYATTTEVDISINPIPQNAELDLIAEVMVASAPTDASGTVTFYIDNAKVGTGTLNAQGIAVFTQPASGLAVGTHTAIAVFEGSTNFSMSRSSALSFSVIAPTATSPTGTGTTPTGTTLQYEDPTFDTATNRLKCARGTLVQVGGVWKCDLTSLGLTYVSPTQQIDPTTGQTYIGCPTGSTPRYMNGTLYCEVPAPGTTPNVSNAPFSLITLQNGWRNTFEVDATSGYARAQMRNIGGAIQLGGNVTGATSQRTQTLANSNRSSVIFTLAAANSPKSVQRITIPAYSQQGGIREATLVVVPVYGTSSSPSTSPSPAPTTGATPTGANVYIEAPNLEPEGTFALDNVTIQLGYL